MAAAAFADENKKSRLLTCHTFTLVVRRTVRRARPRPGRHLREPGRRARRLRRRVRSRDGRRGNAVRRLRPTTAATLAVRLEPLQVLQRHAGGFRLLGVVVAQVPPELVPAVEVLLTYLAAVPALQVVGSPVLGEVG